MATWNAINFPAIFGWTVTEKHAKECAEKGHATHVVDGKLMDMCPRCGEVTEKRDRYEVRPSDNAYSIWDNAAGTWADASLKLEGSIDFSSAEDAKNVARLMNAAAVVR